MFCVSAAAVSGLVLGWHSRGTLHRGPYGGTQLGQGIKTLKHPFVSFLVTGLVLVVAFVSVYVCL